MSNGRKPTCSIEGCDNEALCRGWCRTHYKRWKRHGDPMITVRAHGLSKTPTWKSWRQMRKRCLTPGTLHYDRYGGRGITICERWNSFENFLADMGERPEGKTLDRYPDPDGNYEPSNCRWATPSEQVLNRSKKTSRTAAP